MRLIKLQGHDGDVYINPDHVVTVAKHRDGAVRICPTFGYVFSIHGPIEDVVAALTDQAHRKDLGS